MNFRTAFALFFAITSLAFSQKDSLKKKPSVYLLWGYNREAYTTSTIHFVNNGTGQNEYGTYDFKIIEAKAHDKPDFDQLGDVVNFTIPQYNIRLGMWFNNKRDDGIEINYDHAKYVVTDGQVVRFKGTINGVYVDKDSLLDRQYFHFEHTDGANFWMVNYMKRSKLYYSKDNNFKFSHVTKVGFGIVIPRTDVTMFGHRLNNNWKIAGISTGLENALHFEFYKHVVFEFSGKFGWANYMNAFVLGKGHGKASHKIGFIEGIAVVGYQF